MRGRKSGQARQGTESDRPDEVNPRNRPQYNADMEVLGRLSPAALARWPTVAKQLTDAGVLGSVDARSIARYCEAFAQWCNLADELAKMLIEFGMNSSRRMREVSAVPQNPTPLATAAPTIFENRRTPNAIMRRVEVERETGLSRSTIYQRVKAGMDPEQAAIIARELYAIYAHSVLGGVYKPVDYGDFETLRLKARLARASKEAMTNELRAGLAKEADQEKHWRAERERINAERRRRGFINCRPPHAQRPIVLCAT
ncbi:P27 family phage terminase small subunit [Paraburkholderia sp. BR14374]|uniref:P27 family phage terminase small subunit n=1 Tax=Paraburkholderia sp. BR14374 TaxID=3237007 RepID=UPI0034CEA1AD